MDEKRRYMRYAWLVIRSKIGPLRDPWSIRRAYFIIDYLRQNRDDLALQAMESEMPAFLEEEGMRPYLEEIMAVIKQAREEIAGMGPFRHKNG